MNILVTGANGQLGREIRIASKSENDTYFFSDIADSVQPTHILDITSQEAVNKFVSDYRIECVINCAAYTNVDKAETDEAMCERLNAEAPAILADAMKKAGGLLVHISTDYVFGGHQYSTPCTESQKCAPTGVYGKTKLHGEQNIIASYCKYIIIRTSWLYSEFGKNFCKTMLSLTATKPQLNVVFDQCGTPTYAWDLAEAICGIVRSRKYRGREGIYHFSNEGVCSWYDFAMMVAEFSGHSQCRILPCHSSEFPSPVERPAYSVLDKTKIKAAFGIEIPYWTYSLKKCISNLK